MNLEPSDAGSGRPDELLEAITSIRRQLVRLTVVVSLMTLALFVTVAAVFGNLVNYFNADVMLWGGATAGAAVAGFLFGGFARRKV